MSKANILYFGDSSSGSTSAHRAEALRRLGHNVIIIDPYLAFPKSLKSKISGMIHFRTGYRMLQGRMARWALQVTQNMSKPELIWVDSGELFGPLCLQSLRKLGCQIVLYNIDDPTGKRDGHKFDSLVKALPLYDLVVVVRDESEKECKNLGAKSVMKVWRGYDEVAHKPFEHAEEIPEKFKSDVAFIGTWMRHEKRDEFLLDLIRRGIPISIWGDRWEKSSYLTEIRPHWKGGSLSGRHYVAAIQGAQICLGLLSEGNRDLHTTRSLEVPYAGGLLCAKRTSEHQQLYEEGVEAVFWVDSKECAIKCDELLHDDSRRESIRDAGMQRVRSLSVGNEQVCSAILNALFALQLL